MTSPLDSPSPFQNRHGFRNLPSPTPPTPASHSPPDHQRGSKTPPIVPLSPPPNGVDGGGDERSGRDGAGRSSVRAAEEPEEGGGDTERGGVSVAEGD